MAYTKLSTIAPEILRKCASKACKKADIALQSYVDKPEKLLGSLDGLAARNCSLVKKNITQLIDDSVELFADVSKKTLNDDLSDISVDNMVFVHMTDYMPKEGKILCARTFGKLEDGTTLPRATVHFTVNNISPVLQGDPEWGDKKIGIIIPSKKLFSDPASAKMLGGVPDDFMFMGDVKIPSGSVIVVHNPEIPQGKLKISPFADVCGVKIIETSNDHMEEVIPSAINKMGYSTIQTDEYTFTKMNNWRQFLNEFGLKVNMHQTSPWGKAEGMLEYINSLRLDNNSWSYAFDKNLYNRLKESFGLYEEFFQEESDKMVVDYKSIFIKTLEQIKKELPLKERSFDYEELSNIIAESKTPSDAIEKIKTKLKLRPKTEETPEGIFNLLMIVDRYMLGSKYQEAATSKFL